MNSYVTDYINIQFITLHFFSNNNILIFIYIYKTFKKNLYNIVFKILLKLSKLNFNKYGDIFLKYKVSRI